MTKRLLIAVFFFLGTTLLFSQQTDAEKDLIKKFEEASKFLYSEPEKAYEEAKAIEKEALKINAKQQELGAIDIQCLYYGATKKFEEMLITGQALYQKAGRYKMPVFQVRAKRHTFEAYIFTGLPDKAFAELEQGSRIINKMDENDPVVIDEKIRLLSSYGNYYWKQGDIHSQLKYFLLSGEQIKKMPNEQQREVRLYFHYSNIGSVYADLNQMDSARANAELALLKRKEAYSRNDIVATSLTTLGRVAVHEKDYQKALSYFKEAENLEGYKNHLNLERLYDRIINSYEQLKQEDSVKIYQAKRDSLKLAVSENQKKSLTTLLNEKEESNPVYLYVLAGFLGIMAIVTFLVVRKNRMLARQEKASREYLEKISENTTTQDYTTLLELLKNNDPAFTACFDEIFPDFTQKLLQINPKIVQTEIEFCALLKLKISTKDIARYKNITLKTAQNKKYLIRKKLSIPTSTDIYHWFDAF